MAQGLRTFAEQLYQIPWFIFTLSAERIHEILQDPGFPRLPCSRAVSRGLLRSLWLGDYRGGCHPTQDERAEGEEGIMHSDSGVCLCEINIFLFWYCVLSRVRVTHFAILSLQLDSLLPEG